MNEFLILVDENDKPWGKLEKILVHKLGLLHRAFSVFIFNANGELLLQQRADEKYHSAGLWTNTCCSHPQYGEDIPDAIKRRLWEELKMKCHTDFVFSFQYKSKFENGLIEHEYDHVYFGFSDEMPNPDSTEVKDWKYMSFPALEADVAHHPEAYTSWMKICLPEVKRHLHLNFENKILAHA